MTALASQAIIHTQAILSEKPIEEDVLTIDTADGAVSVWMRPYLREEIVEHLRDWSTNHQDGELRFGQWWWNNYGGQERLGISSCPLLFYQRNRAKAANFIIQHFVRDPI